MGLTYDHDEIDEFHRKERVVLSDHDDLYIITSSV
jgi:hypothetical protein